MAWFIRANSASLWLELFDDNSCVCPRWRNSEATLLKAGALQNPIFSSANFSSIGTDANGVIQIFNVGAERVLGYTAVAASVIVRCLLRVRVVLQRKVMHSPSKARGPMIADGNTIGIPAQVVQHLRSAAEGGFRIDNPVLLEQSAKESPEEPGADEAPRWLEEL
jgi:hypothetical protein